MSSGVPASAFRAAAFAVIPPAWAIRATRGRSSWNRAVCWPRAVDTYLTASPAVLTHP
ncbi:hypothetical protein NRO40_28245 [Streptomyces changanensis]|uniref:Uncharacterized protein n=1 Tax=Streptomyces changanensis TaxID=2964669 RepID=A0ABY5NE66_9ACTN|nr:hypothetical protein [Streptomyces changanensis]UUS34337.1 hypothetical protein NRO40_28245 [Streptomyces changanensis]